MMRLEQEKNKLNYEKEDNAKKIKKDLVLIGILITAQSILASI